MADKEQNYLMTEQGDILLTEGGDRININLPEVVDKIDLIPKEVKPTLKDFLQDIRDESFLQN